MSLPSGDQDETTEKTSDLVAARRKKLKQLEALGIDPWGQRFDNRSMIGDLRSRAGEIHYRKESGEEVPLPSEIDAPGFDFKAWKEQQGKGDQTGPTVRAAGRIVLHRDKGKTQFLDIEDWTGRIQLYVGKPQVGDDNWQIVECLDLGDLIGVDGTLRRTNTGELSIFATRIHFLTKTLEPPPAKHVGMTDPELRQRLRYIDLAWNEGSRDRFLARTRIVKAIRKTLDDRGYCEIEGPTLHTIAGGAAARPFRTHHNTLDMPLVLRIALELHLKRLLVGGMERVYELGRVYRNEGISPRHNPEFTMLELYEAYANYETMMEITEEIISASLLAAGTGPIIPWGDKSIDFSTPFARRSYNDLFASETGVDPGDSSAVQALARSIGLDTTGKHPDVVKSEVFEARVEDALVGPVFVIDYPASICPLTKRKTSDPSVAERFELFVHGMELANAYTELNDPDLQQKLFETQLEGMAEDDSMARMDHDFVRALRNGMPPAGGLGIGIDRLVMLLTHSPSIRDVILFPLLREQG